MSLTIISSFKKPISCLQERRQPREGTGFGTRQENSETEVTTEPLGDSGHPTPYPRIPFFIFLSFPHTAYSSALEKEATGPNETSHLCTKQHIVDHAEISEFS